MGFGCRLAFRERHVSAKWLAFFCGVKYRYWPKATDIAPQLIVRFRG